MKVFQKIHLSRDARGRQRIHRGEVAVTQPAQLPGRMPRIAKLVALSLRFDVLVRTGTVANYAEIARLGIISRGRMTQIMNPLHLAPDILEEILFLPRITRGRDPITEHQLRKIVKRLDWNEQRRLWRLPLQV